MASRRRYSFEKKQEQISRAQFREFLEPHEWITSDIDPDLGEDIIVRIYDKGISTGLSLYVQLKSVQDIEKIRLKSGVISYPFKVDALEHWENQDPPVYLAVWDINRRQGWWISSDAAVRKVSSNDDGWREKQTVQVHLPYENIFDGKGLARIRQALADRIFPIVFRDKKLDIHASFEFPPTPEGRSKLEELRRHIDAGDPVTIDSPYIKEFDLPVEWQRLYGQMDPNRMFVKLGSTQSLAPQPVQIDFISRKFGHERINWVELRIIKSGRLEITLSNEHQNIPFQFRIILNKETLQHQITINIRFNNVDVYTAQQGIKIQQILANGGQIRLTMKNTGASFIKSYERGIFPAPIEKTVRLIENLIFIQETMGVDFRFPDDGSYSHEDEQAVEELLTIIHTGSNYQKGMVFSVELRKPAICRLVDDLRKGEVIRFQIESEDSFIDLLSQQVTLGPMIQNISGKWEMSFEEVSTWLEAAQVEDALLVRLVDADINEEFGRWKKDDQSPAEEVMA